MFCIVSEIKWHVQNEQEHNLCEHIVGIFPLPLTNLARVLHIPRLCRNINLN